MFNPQETIWPGLTKQILMWFTLIKNVRGGFLKWPQGKTIQRVTLIKDDKLNGGDHGSCKILSEMRG